MSSSHEITEDLPKVPSTNLTMQTILEMIREVRDSMATKKDLAEMRADMDRRFDQVDKRLTSLEKGNGDGTP